MSNISARQLRASIDITASPSAVWRVVSDLHRTPEWSPQCRRVIPFGAVRAGCRLVGVNRRGAVVWVTLSSVTEYQPEREIAWRVNTNRSVWTYRIDATASGARLVETRDTPRGINPFARWFTARFLNGQTSLDDELETGMALGLRQIKTLVEQVGAQGADGARHVDAAARDGADAGRP